MDFARDYHFLFIIVVALTLGWFFSFITRKAISRIMQRRKSDDHEADVTRLRFLKNSVSMIFFGLALIYIFLEIPALNNLGKAMFAGAGVLAAVIGFASQKAFSNIISGIFVLLFRPYRIGDTIEVGTRMGTVEDITLRHTVIRDYSNKRILIPNSVISDDTIINSDTVDKFIRQQVFFGISYESDVDKAMDIIREEAEAHRFYLDRRSPQEKAAADPSVVIRLVEMDDSAIKLRAQVWAADVNDGYVLKCDMLKSVKERFSKSGIEIPYPHRTLVSKDGSAFEVESRSVGSSRDSPTH